MKLLEVTFHTSGLSFFHLFLSPRPTILDPVEMLWTLLSKIMAYQRAESKDLASSSLSSLPLAASMFLQHSSSLPLVLSPLSPFSWSCRLLHFCISVDFLYPPLRELTDAHGFNYQLNSEDPPPPPQTCSLSLNLSPELWIQPSNSLKTPPHGYPSDTSTQQD